MVSKNASVKLRPGSAISSGTVAIADISAQPRLTSMKPSRERSSRLWRRVAAHSAAPEPRQTSAAAMNRASWPSA